MEKNQHKSDTEKLVHQARILKDLENLLKKSLECVKLSKHQIKKLKDKNETYCS